ncbi:MAG: hypothetical protein Q8O46_05275 [bacterium]|nr:hypothetical protein [bacterium]
MNFLKLVRNVYRNLQIGDGALTRSQARQSATEQTSSSSQEPKASTSASVSANIQPDRVDIEYDGGADIADDVDMKEEDEVPESIPHQDVPHENLFSHETLVAENDLLKAYVIKEFHKKQKIFK